MNDGLQDLRKSLDNLDSAIVMLLAERFRVTNKVGELKANYRLEAQDKRREKELFERLESLAKDKGLEPEFVHEVWRLIIDKVIENHSCHKDNAGKI